VSRPQLHPGVTYVAILLYDSHGNEADLEPQLRIIVTLVTGGTQCVAAKHETEWNCRPS